MNVACPSCSTRYSVDDARIPPSGVTIKCPKCQHVFVAKKDAPARDQSAVALPGTAAPGTRGAPVALPGRSAQPSTRPPQPAAPAAPPQRRAEDDGDLDLGLDDVPAPAARPAARPAPAPAVPQKPAAPPRAAQPAPAAPAAPGNRSAGAALDFIDDTAGRAGVKASGAAGAPEYRVRRRNGRIEGPYGVGRIVAMLKNKEFTGGEDISEDGVSWRSMTSNRELNAAINDLAAADDGLSFGNVDFGSDLAAPPPGTAPPPKPAAPGRPQAPKPGASGGGFELASPLDDLAGGGHGELDLGGDDAPRSTKAAPKPSVAYGPGIPSEDELHLPEPGHAAAPAGKKPRGGSTAAGAPGASGGGELEVGEIPELPPIWKTYRKPILAFVGVIVLFLAGFFTHLWTPCGAYGVKCLASLFAPPPPAPPQPPPPPPPKMADAREIAHLIDEGSYEGFRSVLATVEKLGPTQPDNMLIAAKARGFASLAFGTKVFSLQDLSKAVEALNTIDLAKALGGNAAAVNMEILKARAALEILNNAQESAATQLATALEQRSDDKELAYLLGLARAKQGDHKGALDALDKAIVSDPSFAPALHAIGDEVLAMQGAEEDAAAWYVKALNAQPEHTRSAIAAAALYAKIGAKGPHRRTLSLASDKVARGLPPEQRAAFLFDTAKAYAEANALLKVVPYATEAARLEPANVSYVAMAADALAEGGKPKDAQALLDPVLVREPGNLEALLSRARVFLTMEDVAKAFIDLEAAKKAAAKDPRVTLWEARFNVELAKLNDARDALNRAIKLDLAGPAHYIELGRIELTVGDVDAAFKSANEAVKRDDGSADAHALLGDCLFSRDELDKAAEAYKRGIQLDDENVPSNLGLANVLRDQGARSARQRLKVAEAMPIYIRLLADNPKNPTIMFEYGRGLELGNDVTSALELYREAATLDEKDVRPHLKMAAAYVEKQPPDLPNASTSIAAARRIEAGTARVNGHVRFWEGRLALLEKRVHDGEASLRTAVEAEPRNAVFHYWLGRAIEENNSLYEAIGYYEKAVSLNSRLGVALRALGRTAVERNQFEKAREWFERYREAAPDDASIWVDMGESYARQNMENQALESFQKAVKFDPSNARALLQIGDILFNKGQESEAAKYFERAAKSDEGYGDAWCQYGQSLARVRVTKEARAALEKCLALPNSAEDLRTNARETLESGAAEGQPAGRRRPRR